MSSTYDDTLTFKVSRVAVRTVALEMLCSRDDTCTDSHAECVDGFCVCRLSHYNKAGACGTCSSNHM